MQQVTNMGNHILCNRETDGTYFQYNILYFNNFKKANSEKNEEILA